MPQVCFFYGSSSVLHSAASGPFEKGNTRRWISLADVPAVLIDLVFNMLFSSSSYFKLLLFFFCNNSKKSRSVNPG